MQRTGDTGEIPIIGAGMDVQALINVTLSASQRPGLALDKAKLKEDLAKLPDQPDESLK